MRVFKRILFTLTFLCTFLAVTAAPSQAACVEKADSTYTHYYARDTTYRVHAYWTYVVCKGSNSYNPIEYGAHYSVVDGPPKCYAGGIGEVDGWRVNIGPFKQFNPAILFVPCQADDYALVRKNFGTGTFTSPNGTIAEVYMTMVRTAAHDIGPDLKGYLWMLE